MIRPSEAIRNRYPARITHPCDHNHPLSLLALSPNGSFSCNACGTHGGGYLYNCNICNVNIHPVCATLPLTVSHSSHCHQLTLVFSSPYGTNIFACDVCGGNGGYCWLYTCRACGFDAHLSCAMSRPQVVTGVVPRSIVPAVTTNQIPPLFMGGVGGGLHRRNSSNNPTSHLLNRLIGGGGGGGGGGGSGVDYSSFLDNGGGGGVDFSSFLGNGGGGGVDFSSFLGNGGGGGMDFSSLLGNGGGFGGLMGGGCAGFSF